MSDLFEGLMGVFVYPITVIVSFAIFVLMGGKQNIIQYYEIKCI